MKKQRRRFTAEKKAAIIRQHLVDGDSVADVCDEHGIKPTVFYRWQKQLFENLPALFEKKSDNRVTNLEGQVDSLKSKLARKDEVIAEITQEYIAVKKKHGDV